MSEIRNGVRVARSLHEAEHAIDGAMKATTALIQNMLTARGDASLAAEVGQDALTQIIGGLSALNGARAHVVTGHIELAQVADRIGFSWRLEGPMEKKIEPTAAAPLRVVA